MSTWPKPGRRTTPGFPTTGITNAYNRLLKQVKRAGPDQTVHAAAAYRIAEHGPPRQFRALAVT
jgi:hypothetical protein